MTDLNREEGSGGDPVPCIGGWRLPDLSSLLGGLVWLVVAVLSVAGVLPVVLAELYLLLAVLVFVPLGLGLLDASEGYSVLYRVAAWIQFPAAVMAAAALALPIGSVLSAGLAVPWLTVTVALALYGLSRVVMHGFGSMTTLAFDAALLYLPVAGVALVLHRLGVSLGFPHVIILLTSVHYHYAGYVLPLVTGLTLQGLLPETKRFGEGRLEWVAATTTLVIVINVALIGIGITFSPTLEIVAVVLFTLAVAVFAITTLLEVVPTHSWRVGAALTLASVSLLFTMSLALWYGVYAYPTTHTSPPVLNLISIPWMIRLHGTMNAFGFALPALAAHRYLLQQDDALKE